MKMTLAFSAMLMIGLFSMIFPNVYAASGDITLDQSEFTLYRGNMITFPVIIEMSDYAYKPTLDIIHNGNLIQKISLHSIGDTFHSVIGLDENWASGKYLINLKYQGEILDSKSFTILRDNEVELAIIIYENMLKTVEPFISLSTNKVILEFSSNEIIYMTGNIYTSQTGSHVIIEITKPDGTSETIIAQHNTDGSFVGLIPIDKEWSTGEYSVFATYFNESVTGSFFIQNNWKTPELTESQLVGSFEITSEKSHEFTILGISGNIITDESEIILSVTKENIVMYENTITLDDDKSFETSMVLYDYITNSPWEYGEYQINGMIDEQSFHSELFTLDEQFFTVPQIQSMDLFLNIQGEMQKMVDISEIEINYRETKQVILSGIIENYIPEESVTVHLISPDGVDSQSHLLASSDGAYYTPIIITDTWISGVYTAYVTYGDFMDEPSTFSVINNVIIDIISEDMTSDDAVQDVTPVEIKNYEMSFSDTETTTSIHYTTQMESYSGKTPIILSLNGDTMSNYGVTYSSDDGFIDYYLLLDYTWSPGKYTVSYVENNVTVLFGTFEILADVTDELIEIAPTSVSHTPLSLDTTLFKVESRFVDTLSFSGVVDYVGNITVKIDDKIISHVTSDSDGVYGGILHVSDTLGVGFHNVSIEYDGISESAEFLIATNDAIILSNNITISRNEILESGGAITIYVSGIMNDFVPSTVQPLFINVSGVESQEFSIMPKMYGYYLQNFVIGDKIGEYDVSVSYEGDTIESYSISVVPAESSWVKSHTELWLDGIMSDESYLKKAVLMLDGYEVSSGVTSPEWFVESAGMWVDGTMSDESFYDAVMFLAENGLL